MNVRTSGLEQSAARLAMGMDWSKHMRLGVSMDSFTSGKNSD
jgi:hypothetical protein